MFVNETFEANDNVFAQVADENWRLEKLLKVKETQICDSEFRSKALSLRAEEFEELFNGQLSSVKSLQSDLKVASNENKTMVKEMEMLNDMFNAMEKQYVSRAMLTGPKVKTYSVKKLLFRAEDIGITISR